MGSAIMDCCESLPCPTSFGNKKKEEARKKSGFLHFSLIWFQVHLEAWHWPCQSSSDGGSSEKIFRTHRPTSDGQHANMVLQKYSPNLCRQPEALSDDNFRETAALVGSGRFSFRY